MKTATEKKAQENLKDWIKRLHAIAEEFRQKGIRPEDQCALRWSANIVAAELNIRSETVNDKKVGQAGSPDLGKAGTDNRGHFE